MKIFNPGFQLPNSFIFLVFFAILLLCGCEYEVPLTEAQPIPVDEALLGVWHPAEEEVGRILRRPVSIGIFRFSDTEYLIQYRYGDAEFYFRAYPIEIDGERYVQLQGIGSHHGPVQKEEVALYHVFSYEVTDEVLLTRAINTDRLDPDIKNSDELREAFLKHRDLPDMFMGPDRWRQEE